MRLIDGDNLEGFAHEPTFGTRDMIENWIEETDLPFEIKVGYDKELKKLCWNVLEGCMNVIKTEETAYDLGKVIDRLKDVAIERRGNNEGMGDQGILNWTLHKGHIRKRGLGFNQKYKETCKRWRRIHKKKG